MGRPKFIDTWYYDVKDLEVSDPVPPSGDEEEGEEPEVKKRVITKKVEIKVYMDKETVDIGGPPYALDKVSFTVKCDEPRFTFVGTDIAVLRDAAWGEMDEKFKIKWDRFYLVKVQPERVWDGMGSAFSFSYDSVYRGTTWDGKLLLRQHPPFAREDKISAWPGRFTSKNGQVIACIPETDENTKALEQFAERVNILRDLIQETLRPEVIMQTLMNMSDLKLLPEAPVEKEEKNADERPVIET